MAANLTPERRTLLEKQLAEAQAAMHSIMIGEGVQQTRDQNGETITYGPANVGNLIAYIRSLEDQLGIASVRHRRPARVFFGR